VGYPNGRLQPTGFLPLDVHAIIRAPRTPPHRASSEPLGMVANVKGDTIASALDSFSALVGSFQPYGQRRNSGVPGVVVGAFPWYKARITGFACLTDENFDRSG
jgi:hypothetical protein